MMSKAFLYLGIVIVSSVLGLIARISAPESINKDLIFWVVTAVALLAGFVLFRSKSTSGNRSKVKVYTLAQKSGRIQATDALVVTYRNSAKTPVVTIDGDYKKVDFGNGILEVNGQEISRISSWDSLSLSIGNNDGPFINSY